MFKKIYIEITNICNLNCHFCIKNNRTQQFMEFNDFKHVIEEVKPFTNYLYFHVMGEPLLHPNINEFIDYTSNNFKINITTNGYLINKIKENKNIRQVNISLHSFYDKGPLSLEEYLTNITTTIEELLNNNTYINLRLWTNSPYTKDILNYLNKFYNKELELKTMKIKENLHLEIEKEFIWPSLNNNYYEEKGTCYGTRTHIGILVDQTVIPCCLDSDCHINLGNLKKEHLKDIISSQRYINIKTNFQNNKKIEELCKHCNFKRNGSD